MSLAIHLSRQRLLLEELVGMLAEERERLCEASLDVEALMALVQSKARLVREIDALEAQRNNAQARLGYAGGRQGAERAAIDAGCLDLWLALRAVALRVKSGNALNGGIVRQRLQANQRMLNLLNDARGSTFYGPTGHSAGSDHTGLAAQA